MLVVAGTSKSLFSVLVAVTIIGSSVKTCSGSSAYTDVPPQMTLPVINAIIRVFFSKLCFIKFNFLSNFNSLIPFSKYSRKIETPPSLKTDKEDTDKIYCHIFPILSLAGIELLVNSDSSSFNHC